MSETGFSRRRSPRVVISRKRYVVITKNGVKFARECYCSSGSLPGTQIELYGFLLSLLSFGGVLPLVAVRRWRRTKILRKASDNQFAVVTGNVGVLPKKVVEEAMREIWGECPKSIYV
jgi:hypothetical protein